MSVSCLFTRNMPFSLLLHVFFQFSLSIGLTCANPKFFEGDGSRDNFVCLKWGVGGGGFGWRVQGLVSNTLCGNLKFFRWDGGATPHGCGYLYRTTMWRRPLCFIVGHSYIMHDSCSDWNRCVNMKGFNTQNHESRYTSVATIYLLYIWKTETSAHRFNRWKRSNY